MKRLLIAAIVILPVVAATASDEKTPKPEPAATEAKAQPSDSPLVQAAKRANRARSKRPVITNETLKSSKGHITTGSVTTVANPPAPVPSMELELRKAALKEREAAQAKEAATAKAAERRREDLGRKASAAEEESLYDENDPAQVEHMLERTATAPDPKKP